VQAAVEFESSGKIEKIKYFIFSIGIFFYQLGIFGHLDWYRLPEVDI